MNRDSANGPALLAKYVGINEEVHPERRRVERVAYRTILDMANYNGQQLPLADEFFEVETRNLTPVGISFYCPQSPRWDMMLLRMGDSDCPIYIPARVIYCRKEDWRDQRFTIGCEFVDRQL